MNPKVFLIACAGVLCANGAVIHSRQKRTLGLAQTALEGATGVLSGAGGVLASGLGTAAKVGTGLLVGKTLLLGLGGKYALYKYLKNKAAQDGVHVGVAGGVGADLPFGLPELNVGGSAGFGFGGADNGEIVYDSLPVVYESSPVVYDSAPIVYDSAPVVYQSSSPVVYESSPSVFNSGSAQFDTSSSSFGSSSSSSIDEYGAPIAGVLG